MPGEGVAIDGESGIFGCIDERRNGGEVHIALVIDTRRHLHGIACNDLVEVGSGQCIEHLFPVELGGCERCAHLEARVSGAVEIFLEGLVVVEVIIQFSIAGTGDGVVVGLEEVGT